MNNDLQLTKNYRKPFTAPDVSVTETADGALVSAADATRTRSWGWLPALSLTSASGLLLVAIADTLSRSMAGQYDGLLWAGLLIMIVPIAARLAAACRQNRPA